VGNVSRKERLRLRRLKKQKEDSNRPHDTTAFLGAFRRMCEGGWGPPHLENLYQEAGNPEEFRAHVESLCNSSGARAGDPDSWCLIAETLEEQDAPLDEILSVLHQWIRAYPRDPRPHEKRVRALFEWGLHDRARMAVQDAMQSPARRDISPGLVAFFSSFGNPHREVYDHWNSHLHRKPLPAERRFAGRLREGRKIHARKESASPPPSPAREKGEIPETPVSFLTGADRGILDQLCSGPHDDLAAIDLACRGVEILAEDRYDRLLSIPTLRGVQELGYQIETVLRVLKRFHGRVLLADEVGLGKTIEACLVLKEYMIRGQVRRALLLVPPALVGQWRAELEEKFGIRARTTQDPGFRENPGDFWKGGPVLIASIAVARQAPHRERLLKEPFDLVIVDEAHHLKNRATKSWEMVNGLRSRFFLLLTATPVETDLAELFNLITLLRPGTPGTEGDFRVRFVQASDPASPRNPEKLRELLQEVMIRNTRARCGVLPPPRTARTYILRPTSGEEELYRVVLEATRRFGRSHRSLFRLFLEEAGSSPLAVAETAARVRGEGIEADLAHSLEHIEGLGRSLRSTAKLERLAHLLMDEKVLVFSHFRATADLIAEDLGRRGIPFAPFHGGMSAEEKNRAVKTFAGPAVPVLLCSEIGGEGRNLQFCHRLINFDLPWNPMKIEQRIGRIHRIGQAEPVEVINLACAGTAEERILDVLDRRLNLFELVIGEMDLLLEELTDERDFEDQVFDIYAGSRGEEDIEKGFNELAERLLHGRGRLERTRALDEKLFGEDYEA